MNIIFVTTAWNKNIWEKLMEELKGNKVTRYMYILDKESRNNIFQQDKNDNLASTSRIDFKINDKNFLVLIQQGKSDSNTKRIEQVISEKCENVSCEIYLAMHQNGGQVTIKDLNIPKDCQLKAKCEFIHEPSDKVYKELTCFVLSFFNKNSQLWKDLGFKEIFSKCDNKSAFNRLLEAIKKKPIIPNLTLLKHRIAHLFLPKYFCWLCEKEKGKVFEGINPKILEDAKKEINEFTNKNKEIELTQEQLNSIFNVKIYGDEGIKTFIKNFDKKINEIITKEAK